MGHENTVFTQLHVTNKYLGSSVGNDNFIPFNNLLFLDICKPANMNNIRKTYLAGSEQKRTISPWFLFEGKSGTGMNLAIDCLSFITSRKLFPLL